MEQRDKYVCYALGLFAGAVIFTCLWMKYVSIFPYPAYASIIVAVFLGMRFARKI